MEVEASSEERIVLDLGMPLDLEEQAGTPVPDIRGLHDSDVSLLGILISHAHQDHWGLVPAVTADVPVFCGEATQRILAEASFWTRGIELSPSGHFRHRQPLNLGPFRITPYLSDHSAFDAYSLLVEADGKKLFYTGDIRGHGRKSALFEQLVRDAPAGIDVLLMEGTQVGLDGEVNHGLPSEDAVEDACVQTFADTKGLALIVFSAQNIDRLVSLYRATKRSSRDLVMDLYGASIAKATGNPNIPQGSWDRVRVFVPPWQQRRVESAGAFERVAEIASHRIHEEDLAQEPGRYVMSFGMSSASRLVRAGALHGAGAVWSLWSGYLDEPSGKALVAFFEERNIPLVQHHTSGHASIADLQRLAGVIDPVRLVPIHTFGSARFGDYFDDVEEQPDGVWWEV